VAEHWRLGAFCTLQPIADNLVVGGLHSPQRIGESVIVLLQVPVRPGKLRVTFSPHLDVPLRLREQTLCSGYLALQIMDAEFAPAGRCR
jgi:hypothetical protein